MSVTLSDRRTDHGPTKPPQKINSTLILNDHIKDRQSHALYWRSTCRQLTSCSIISISTISSPPYTSMTSNIHGIITSLIMTAIYQLLTLFLSTLLMTKLWSTVQSWHNVNQNHLQSSIHRPAFQHLPHQQCSRTEGYLWAHLQLVAPPHLVPEYHLILLESTRMVESCNMPVG